VTIQRPNSAATAPIEAAPGGSLGAPCGVDDLASPLEAVRLDRISLSARAGALIEAGLKVRAYVMRGLEQVRAYVALPNGWTLVLEDGLYGLR